MDFDDMLLDGRQIGNLPRRKAFELGFECGVFHARLETGLPFSCKVHGKNMQRAKMLAHRAGRLYKVIDYVEVAPDGEDMVLFEVRGS